MENNPLAQEPAAPAPVDGAVPESAPVENQSQQAASFHQMIDENGAFKEGAWDSFPVQDGEDLSKFQRLGEKTPDLSTLVRNHVQLERLLSNEKLPLPKPEDGAEAWDRVHDALGRPKEAKYELAEGVEIPDETKEVMDGLFHKAGLSQRQADALYADTAELLTQSAAHREEAGGVAAEEAVKALEESVGPRSSQQYADAIERAENVAQHLGLADEALFKVPGFAGKMADLYDTLIDSKIKGVENTSISKGQNIQAEIDSIQNNPNDPRYADYRRSDWNAAHQHVMDLMNRLEEAKNAQM
jgi:hypothetical protein